jgi:transcriptional regulator with XRE-family HTH domain
VLAADQTLALVLRRLRLERGITQEAVAFNANVTVSALSRIERGQSNPTWTTLVKIADALDITPVELIAAAEAARKQPPAEAARKQPPERG